MPADSIVSTIVSTIISSVAEGVYLAPPPSEPGIAIIRSLPEETRKGMLAAYDFGQVIIDGKSMPLSPGAQVRNEMNMIVMPSVMNNGPVKVRYQIDFAGYVYRIWILSTAEASLPENR